MATATSGLWGREEEKSQDFLAIYCLEFQALVREIQKNAVHSHKTCNW